MADFCKQCSIENFKEDFGDLKNLGNGEKLPPNYCGWEALCEGCGFTIVNDEGKCISTHCEVHGTDNRNADLKN